MHIISCCQSTSLAWKILIPVEARVIVQVPVRIVPPAWKEVQIIKVSLLKVGAHRGRKVAFAQVLDSINTVVTASQISQESVQRISKDEV